jgi:hypothetical protein
MQGDQGTRHAPGWGKLAFVAAVSSQFSPKQSTMVPKFRPAIMLAGCSQWIQQERAPTVSPALIDFLRPL